MKKNLSQLIKDCHTRKFVLEQDWTDEHKQPMWEARTWIYKSGWHKTPEEAVEVLEKLCNKHA